MKPLRHPAHFLPMLLAGMTCLAFSAISSAQTTTVGTQDDPFTPHRNAVAIVGKCTGTLVTDRHVIAAAHCFGPMFRAPKPPGSEEFACGGLEQQAGFQEHSWEDPAQWYSTSNSRFAAQVRFGNRGRAPRLTLKVVAYSLPRCTDLVLLELAQPLPRYIARPVQILSTPPTRIDRFFSSVALRHAGWGMPTISEAPSSSRRTGPVGYWGHNACHLIALPPLRENGQRILPGDSGAPLLMQINGQEALVGVLWGSGPLDQDACGKVTPPPPYPHGSYTPTWRGTVAGTDATDIGTWLRQMLPEASHVAPEQ